MVIKSDRVYEEVVAQIRELISGGMLKPGDRLPAERELAQRLKVGRSSVREAIRGLEVQGLVVTRHGAGTSVTANRLEAVVEAFTSRLTEEQRALWDVLEMRRVLEPQMASLAAGRATPEDMERLQAILQEQEDQIASGETGVKADAEFHSAIARATHNSAFSRLIFAIEDIVNWSREQYLHSPERSRRSLAAHRGVLAAIQRRDFKGAQRAMQQHIVEVEREVKALAMRRTARDRPMEERA